MNENKFNIRKLARWREQSEAMFRSMGLRESQYADDLGRLADLGTDKIIAKASQFLFDFNEHGAEAMRERYECKSLTTPYNHRTFALGLISKKVTG
ncbi:hypothetical protein EAH75_01370 [Rhodanobacter glycinis]|uniref:hypothetical protein n=1 Tax=Rhodanobacter glycinis TaxID=582702 RepID=UPI001129251D|nr:hypothetical protein [Rhodanobacter glycinis]TPG50175.1 hypothetical protein EAH75_01370 [Rhodanobacter glycinis]